MPSREQSLVIRNQRHESDRNDQRAFGVVAVEAGELGDAGLHPVLVRKRIDAIPKLLNQLANEREAFPQARESFAAQKTLREPHRNLDVLGGFSEKLGCEIQDRRPLGRSRHHRVVRLESRALANPRCVASVFDLVVRRRGRGIGAQVFPSRRFLTNRS